MFRKKIVAKCFLLVLTLIPLCIKGQSSIKSTEVPDKSVEIILNEIDDGGRSKIKLRDIFILIGENDFNIENLNKLFDKFKKLYPEPYNLRITIYSSREMIQRLIDFKKFSPIEFTDDEKGREASDKYYEKYYPLPKGYFRADYFRYGKFEFFDYSPKKEDTEMIRISLEKEIR